MAQQPALLLHITVVFHIDVTTTWKSGYKMYAVNIISGSRNAVRGAAAVRFTLLAAAVLRVGYTNFSNICLC